MGDRCGPVVDRWKDFVRPPVFPLEELELAHMCVLEIQRWTWRPSTHWCGLVGYRMPCLHMAVKAGLEAGPGTPATQENEEWITEFNQYLNSFFQAAS